MSESTSRSRPQADAIDYAAVDVHAHYVSPLALESASKPGLGVEFMPESRRIHFPSGPSRPISYELTDLAAREFWMESRQLTAQVISPWMDLVGDELTPEQEFDWCRVLNDATATDINHNSRFRAFAALPASKGELAAMELRRCVDEFRFVGGVIPTQIGNRDLVDAELDALFEAAESLGVTLFIHPFRVLERARLSENFLHNVCGNPFEVTIAALKLVFSATFERWPRLRILLSHCGGTLPFLAGRAKQASQEAPSMSRAMSTTDEIMGHFLYDTVLHDPRALSFAISQLGSRLALGTDAPFPMGLSYPLAHVRDALSLEGNDTQTPRLESITSRVPALICGEDPD